MRSFGSSCALALIVLVGGVAIAAGQSNVESLYKQAMALEATLRAEIDSRKAGTPAVPLLERARTLAQTYEDLARLFPRSGYSDNALWQGAMLAADAFREFGQSEEKAHALELFEALESRFPSSSLVKQIPVQAKRLASAPDEEPDATSTAPSEPAPAAIPASSSAASSAPSPTKSSTPSRPSTLRAIRREVLPHGVRVTLELERETPFYDERIDGPPRVFVDLQNTRAVAPLRNASLAFDDDVVRGIRVGRQEDARTRVVVDLEGAAKHSVYALYNPYRVVIDFERLVPKTIKAVARKTEPRATTAPVPVPPSKNNDGGFSLSRQLGLGVGRIVIDPGHGGHDPGARVRGLSEAELTLDIALRLEKLLQREPGVEVVLTRRTNAYVSLEERTAIANRAEADLFLSIHANASGDARAAGIETYFLNFASNSAAEAVAARENAGSSRTMGQLTDIVKTIALNNKIDESRDFAAMVQASMYERLRRFNRRVKNLGVKQAPFVVLIGATMPSALAEISFLTNRQEAALLRTAKYRDQIAAALFNGVMKYQRSLKTTGTMATQ